MAAPILDIMNVRIIYRDNVNKYTVSFDLANNQDYLIVYRILANYFISVDGNLIQYDNLSQYGTVSGYLNPNTSLSYDIWADWFLPVEFYHPYNVCLRIDETEMVNGVETPVFQLMLE